VTVEVSEDVANRVPNLGRRAEHVGVVPILEHRPFGLLTQASTQLVAGLRNRAGVVFLAYESQRLIIARAPALIAAPRRLWSRCRTL
jgi:hypothetical protein